MRAQRRHVGPAFEEHDPQRVVGVAVPGVRDAPPLGARLRDMARGSIDFDTVAQLGDCLEARLSPSRIAPV